MAVLELVKGGLAHPDIDLVAESNHRIANHLSLLVGMVQLQASYVAKGPETFTKTEVRGMLQETAGKIISIGNFHRRMAQRPAMECCDLGTRIIEYTKELIHSLALGAKLSLVERIGRGCDVTPEQAQTAMLVVGEIVMNAIKHAHPTGLPVAIAVTCERNHDGSVSLEVADDGIGLPENFDPMTSTGLGMRLIRSLCNKLDAGLEIESDSLGLTFRMRIPPV
ncbi:MAG TPA: sensor histidine kinase [Rhizomicrobium sp.]|jgi:two-component sensor histidine kinase